MLNYPLRLDNNWFDNSVSELSDNQKNWLFEVGSLTAKLKLNSNSFEVRVLNETSQMLCAAQANILGIKQQIALFREVVLYCDNQAQVYAQSWIPLGQKTNTTDELSSLGAKPLGEMIFKDPHLKRETIEIAQFNQYHPIAQLCQSIGLKQAPCWGRRSVFSLLQQKLLVCEVFLPGSLIETSTL